MTKKATRALLTTVIPNKSGNELAVELALLIASYSLLGGVDVYIVTTNAEIAKQSQIKKYLSENNLRNINFHLFDEQEIAENQDNATERLLSDLQSAKTLHLHGGFLSIEHQNIIITASQKNYESWISLGYSGVAIKNSTKDAVLICDTATFEKADFINSYRIRLTDFRSEKSIFHVLNLALNFFENLKTTEDYFERNNAFDSLTLESISSKMLFKMFKEGVARRQNLYCWENQYINSSEFCELAFSNIIANTANDKEPGFIVNYLNDNLLHFPVGMGVLSSAFVAAIYNSAAVYCMSKGDLSNAAALIDFASSLNQHDLRCERTRFSIYSKIDGKSSTIEEIDIWLKDRFCENAFVFLETTTSEEFYRCCPAYLPLPVGRFSDGSIEEVVNSAESRSIMESIIDGSFKYCSRQNCNRITTRNLPKRENVDLEKYKNMIWPESVTLSHDASCNLSCPSCRSHKIMVPKLKQEKYDGWLDRFIFPLLNQCQEFKVCGSGDPFASPHFRKLLKAYCEASNKAKRKIILHTNGVLCDQKAWNYLGLSNDVKEIMVSVDAGTAETYKYTRRDGNYDKLWKNLRFLSELRKNHGFDKLTLLFVVQAKNFREMPIFVQQAKSIEADAVEFTQIRNWGTYSTIEYMEHNIFSKRHPDHIEFQNILNSVELLDPIVSIPKIWYKS